MEARRLMDEDTFTENFKNVNWPRKTYLCYEVELPDGDSRVPPGWDKGFLRNKPIHMPGPPRDAEMRFLDLISSWKLDQKLRYRVTCFISWSPCADCAQRLAEFLRENSHVSLRIFASRIFTKGDYKAGLRTLQAAEAQIAIMASEGQHSCPGDGARGREKPVGSCYKRMGRMQIPGGGAFVCGLQG
nr:PREDICTED: DNA dC->dU-editing enzyme APOBEC-3G-like isoform X3 [Equus przewalskii]